MKTERKTAALRRGMVLLCTLVLTLMAVTLPASAKLTGSLTDKNIVLTESDFNEGSKGTIGTERRVRSGGSTWAVVGSETIQGTVKPKEWYLSIRGQYTCYEKANASLTITNNSNQECLLSFSYKVPDHGTLTFDPARGANNGIYTTTLQHNASVTVTLTTPKTDWQDGQCQDDYTAATELSNITLKPLDENVSVKLESATNGIYTAKIGGTSLNIPGTYSKPAKTEYTFTSGAAAPNYVFYGWKVNGKVVSTEYTYTTTFANDSTVEAVFVDDPLLSVIKLGGDTTGPVTDYIAVNSDYNHNVKGSNHTNHGDTNMNNSYGPPTYFPDSRWSTNGSGGITSSTDYTKYGAATGDNQTSLGYSQAAASLYSDIIRVYCKENCIISFDSSMTAQEQFIQNSGSSDDQYGVFLYYYASPKEKETANTIKTHGTPVIKNSYKGTLTKHTVKDSVSGTRVVVNKGEYLYLYAYARTRYDDIFLGGTSVTSGYAKNEYSYSATISSFTVTPNNETVRFATRNTDNTDTVLEGGTVTVNGVDRDVSKAAYTAELAKGTTLTLTKGNAPTGYTFIGWHNVKTGANDYTHDTITVTMTEDCEINPIYVPAMTITCGTNGYENATYRYKNLSGEMETPTNQYVARNATCTAFYKTLKDAFNATDTVFLLAEDIIVGDLTIPAGKTLVIPDRLADPGPNIQTGLPEQYVSSESIKSYCKVICKGSLTVEGTLVVNARQTGAGGGGVCGRAAGGIGYLSLDGSTITVKNGGSLFGYGLIRGGSISAESGSTVRELMEISDMRSALVMKEIYDKKGSMKVFPFSNFSIKTIESPVTYAYGAKLYAQYSVMLEGKNQSTGAAPLIAASDALFNLKQGSMTKYYDPTTYKTVYRVDENSTMDTGFFSLEVNFAVGDRKEKIIINTKEYLMPLNAGFDLRTAGNMTVNGDFKFLPGASLSVEKGGTCTVANGVNLLFYRLNDYDTRGIGNKIYQKGYSSKIYPVNATKLPDGPKPTTNPAEIGSARLNVDGEMIVNGGLYVSNKLVSESDQGFTTLEPVDGGEKTRQEINAAYFNNKVYDNGYNVLTGTGSIDMTAVQTKQPEVYEAMTAQNTNDPAWAPIPISLIKGLKADATEDIPGNYQALDQKANYYGVYRPGGFYTWTTEEPKVAKIINGTKEQIFRSLADAVSAYTGEGYIQMITNSAEPGFTLDKDVYLDLNGKTVTFDGTLTVAEGKNLYGMDSATDTYVGTDAGKIVGKVNGTVAPVFETTLKANEEYEYHRYVAIQSETGYSFHRFNISVSGYRFELATGNMPECALFFISKFQGDTAAKDYLASLGITLTGGDEKPIGTPLICMMPDALTSDAEGGKTVILDETDSSYLFEAYLKRVFEKTNSSAYTEKFGAVAQATFKNNGMQPSEQQHWSFQDAWENPGKIAPEQQEILDKFLAELDITNQTE